MFILLVFLIFIDKISQCMKQIKITLLAKSSKYNG